MDSSASGIAIVVTYNSSAEIAACLASLLTQEGVSLDVRVVDNASGDGTADRVRSAFPAVRLTANRENVGFARANNQVLTHETPEYFVLVNPDTVLPRGAVAACVAELARDPRAGIVATRLVSPEGELQPSCHSFLGLANLFGETFFLDRLLPGWHAISSLNLRWFGHDRRREVDWIQGAFLVVRGALCRSVGAFDPDYFMYGEEMDWCYRARQEGWKVVFLPEPAVVHVGGASSRPIAGPMFVETLKARLRFLRKHRSRAVLLAARILQGFEVALRWLPREAAGLALPAIRSNESFRLRLVMFRAAAAWVARGLPLSPYRPTPVAPAERPEPAAESHSP